MACLHHWGYFRQSEDEDNMPEEKIKEHERTHSISCVSCLLTQHGISPSNRILINKRRNRIRYMYVK